MKFDSNLLDAFNYVDNLGEKHKGLGSYMDNNKWFKNCFIELVGLKYKMRIF